MLVETLHSLAYSTLGLIIGFMIGRLTREVHEVKEVVCPDEHTGHVHPAHEKPTGKQGPVPTTVLIRSRTLGVMLIILSLVTVLLSTITAIDNRRKADCNRRYNIEFVRVFLERSKAADQDRDSLNKMLRGIDSPDRAVRERVFRDYLTEIAATEEQRKQNPLPAPPDPATFCKGPIE
jgi:hypothetical protein